MQGKNQIQFIVDELNRPAERKLVILMTSTHPMTDKNLCQTGHEIYCLDIPQFPIKWHLTEATPDNFHVINDINVLPHRPDIILSQNVVDQYNIMKSLSYQFDCPVIEFEHTLPTDMWLNGGIVDQVRQNVNVSAYVFITDYSKEVWKRQDDENAFTIYHMVDTGKYEGWSGRNGKAMMLVNAFQGREWAVGNIPELMDIDKKEKITLYGINPGCDSQALDEAGVIRTMQEHDVFVNTSIRSPIPASVLEAASVGMPIVSTKTCAIPDFFVDGESILFYETYEECVELTYKLLGDRALCKKLGANARRVIEKHFNKERYIADWENILEHAMKNYNYE